MDDAQRAGRYIQQSSGYKAFIPAPLPPEPPVAYSGPLQTLLSQADRHIGRLDALASMLPNPDLFVAMYVRHEAVLSSQIEGTQSTLEDVLAFEADASRDDTPKDVEEVVNYVRAMNHGLERLSELPLSLRLLREIHAELMKGVRGGEKSPGEFRTSQNWIGGRGSTLRDAAFIPPPPHELMNALGQLETFLHSGRESVPLLVRCGLAHAQFETIHPFLDGNGRVGRLLITLMLCEERALSRPLLYLSLYLKAHRAEYYDRLTAIRSQGHWEPWLMFFLRGVSATAQAATKTAQNIVALRDKHRSAVARNAKALVLLDHLFKQPGVSVSSVARLMSCTFPTASKLVTDFEARGWLKEMTGYGRNRFWRYQPYLDLFHHEALDAMVGDAQGAGR
ncbi:Fic family protein [Hydrogenophaga sp. IBVHS1]|uniref:Fic family protein n=1 Tax=unclassified Hydrogenophaga TaxID=2610897 RepID=UPI000A2E4010|nr:Fic family protein [Hydrogenophaga sp. IBVHS1]OSZ71259.1 cell filamentation protein Fic [Hydrogenophaga sp. IBVHS1]